MTLQDYKDSKNLSYSKLGELLGCSKSRAYDICKGIGGALKIEEINKINKATGGLVSPVDLGLQEVVQ